MSRSEYYAEMKRLANQVRQEFDLTTPRVMRNDMRRIYKAYNIKIDLWPHKLKQLRGAFIFDDLGATVMIAKSLPDDPFIFTMGHELKHYLKDRHLGLTYCDASKSTEHIEIGAEIFAAELIYPEQDFAEHLLGMGVKAGQCQPETIVHLKKQTRTTLSYTGLAKRAEFMGYAVKGSLPKAGWKSLEEKLYGVPVYQQRRTRTFS